MLKQVKDLLLKIPLYTPQKVEHDDHARLFRLKFFADTFDCFCQDCGTSSTFKGVSKGLSVKGYNVPNFKNFLARFLDDYEVIKDELLQQIYIIEAECITKSNHRKAAFIFKVDTNYIEKIGQYPAPSVLSEHLIEAEESTYELPFETPQELFAMLDAAAEQMGLSSFVYAEPDVRTEIETSLTSFADFFFYQKGASIENWDQKAYDTANNSTKVSYLKQHFTQLDAAHQQLFDVFKQGVYPLSDKACKDSLPLTKICLNLLVNPAQDSTSIAPESTNQDSEDRVLSQELANQTNLTANPDDEQATQGAIEIEVETAEPEDDFEFDLDEDDDITEETDEGDQAKNESDEADFEFDLNDEVDTAEKTDEGDQAKDESDEANLEFDLDEEEDTAEETDEGDQAKDESDEADFEFDLDDDDDETAEETDEGDQAKNESDEADFEFDLDDDEDTADKNEADFEFDLDDDEDTADKNEADFEFGLDDEEDTDDKNEADFEFGLDDDENTADKNEADFEFDLDDDEDTADKNEADFEFDLDEENEGELEEEESGDEEADDSDLDDDDFDF